MANTAISSHHKVDYVIFSVSKNTDKDEINTKNIVNFLNFKKIMFKKVDGGSKGVQEQSFLVNFDHFETLKSLIFETYDQDCVLLLRDLGQRNKVGYIASFLGRDGRTTEQGYFVPAQFGTKCEDYSIIDGFKFIIQS